MSYEVNQDISLIRIRSLRSRANFVAIVRGHSNITWEKSVSRTKYHQLQMLYLINLLHRHAMLFTKGGRVSDFRTYFLRAYHRRTCTTACINPLLQMSQGKNNWPRLCAWLICCVMNERSVYSSEWSKHNWLKRSMFKCFLKAILLSWDCV